jgi:tRNA(Ile)-lysidine synthase
VVDQLKRHIHENLPFLEGKKILVACSGGVDSVVLTYLLKELNYTIGLAHCNFSLRGKESDEDESFVIDLADKLSIPVFSETFDTKKYAKDHKVSTQMAARDLRYNWFEEILKDFKYDYVTTGHHADDDLETFFINLSRGTGLRGLLGIPAINDKVVRPLLSFGRDEILTYAKEKALYWREDSSNLKADYLRNALRLEVLPHYKKSTDGLVGNFQKTQKHLKDSQNLIEDYMALVYNLAVTKFSEGYKIDIQKLLELPHTEALLFELLATFGFTDLPAVSDLLTTQSGKQVFSKTHRLLKDRDLLLLTEIVEKSSGDEFFISEGQKKITSPILLEFNSTDAIGDTTKSVIYIDRDKIDYPLHLRKWRKGDAFQPFGMQGKKKLSKFFKDEKLSLVAKEKIWVLCSGEHIIWIVGIRADDRFRVTSDTKHIIKITSRS